MNEFFENDFTKISRQVDVAITATGLKKVDEFHSRGERAFLYKDPRKKYEVLVYIIDTHMI